MGQEINGGVNIYLNEPEMAAQIARLTTQADKLQATIASGSNAAKLTEDALKKMADKESDLRSLQNAATALKSEIEQISKAGGNATAEIKQLGTTTAAINNVEKQINQLGNTINSTAKNQADLTANMNKLADVKDKIALVEKQMSGELSPTLRQAGDAVRRLYNELSNLPNGSAAFLSKKAQFDAANTSFAQMQLQVKGVKDSLHAAGEEGGFFGKIFKATFAALTIEHGAELATEKIVDFFKEAIKEALEYEVIQARLKNILENFGKGEDLEKFNAKAEELAKRFPQLYAPEINKVQTQLVTFGKLNNDQINQLLPIIIDFSAKYGRGMTESSEIVLKALEGNRKSLHDMGIEIKQGSNFADNYGIVLKQLGQRVAGAADAFGKTGAGAIAIYNTQLKELQERLGTELLPAFTSGLSGASKFVAVLGALPKFVNDNRQAIIALAGAYVVMNAAVIASTLTTGYNTAAKVANTIVERASTIAKTAGFIATGLYGVAYAVLSGEIGLATAATAVFGTVTAAATGGLTLIIAAVAAIGTAVAVYASQMTDAEKVERALIDVRVEAAKSVAAEKSELDQLLLVAKDETLSKEKRLSAINRINAINPEYLNGITLDNVATKEGTAILSTYIDMLDKEALKKATAAERTKLYQEKIEAQTRSVSDSVTWYEKLGATFSPLNSMYSRQAILTAMATEKNYEEIKSIDAKIKALDDLDKAQNHKEDVKDPKATELAELQKFYAQVEQYQKDFAAINVSSSTEEVNHVRAKYEELNNELAKHQSEGVISLQKYFDVKQVLSNNDAVKELENAQKKAEEKAKKDAEALKKKQEQEQKAMEAFMQQLASLRNENGILEQDETAKSIAASRDKYEKLYQYAKDNWGEDGKITQELERYYAEEVNRANDKNTEQKFKASYDNRVKLITAMYAELKSKAEGDKAAVLALDVAEYDAKAALAKDYTGVVKTAIADQAKAQDDAAKARVALELEVQKKIKEADAINDSTDLLIAQINKNVQAETDSKLKALKDRYSQEQIAFKNNAAALLALARKYAVDEQKIITDGTKATLSQATGYYNKFASTLNQVVSTIVSFQNQADDATLASAKKTADDKNAILQQQLDAGKISQAQYNAAVKSNNDQYAAQEREVKKKEWERNRNAQVISAISTGITTVLNAYADGLEAGGPAGPLVGAVFAALAGGFVGAQVALLEAQPTPQFARGGIAEGPSHSRGGIAMVDSSSGRKVGEMEGGEAYMILSGNTTRNNRAIINELLRTSMNGGGGEINWAKVGAVPRFDLGGIMNTMSTMKFANGGIFPAMHSQSQLPDPRMNALMGGILNRLQQPSRSYIVYDDLATGATRVINARNRATFQS